MEGNERMTIKAWAEEDRPREKLMNKGRRSLTNAELMSILLRSGSSMESAVDLAKKILNSVGNDLASLGNLSVHDLTKFRGMGEAKAISIIAALELGRRRRDLKEAKKDTISASNDVTALLRPFVADLQHEEFWVLYLNRANKILAMKNISSGGLSGTVVDSRIVFKIALEHLASSIILCHNHPSGSTKPSEADIRLTKQLSEAGKMLDIAVLDHIIITAKSFYSFADEGLL